MTCIVGYVKDGTVYMGGDRAGVDMGTHAFVTWGEPKIFKRIGVSSPNSHGGEFLIGYTSSFRFGQLLQHSLKIPAHPKTMSDTEYMVTEFMEAVRKTLKDGGYLKTENGVESSGNALIGYRGKLWLIESNMLIAPARNDFGGDSIGSGFKPALGAMSAIHQINKDAQTPETIIKICLRAATQILVTVREPFDILSIEGK